MTARIRIVLADPQPIVLDGAEHLFATEPGFRVLARCLTGEDALAAVRRHHPDVLILDPHMPRTDGLTILRELHRAKPRTRVVLFAASISDDEAIDALRLGVHGMVLKEQASHQLVQCVRKVFAGGEWIEKNTYQRALETLLRREAGARAVGAVLTPREIEMVRMVATGLATRQIAERLMVTEGTVKVHLHNVYRKLNLASRVELVLYAQSKQLT